LQDETGGFQTFIPLAFHPENNPLGQGIAARLRPSRPQNAGETPALHQEDAGETPALRVIPKPSGLTDLKTMAISRLMLDNFPHVKAYWQMLGVKTAQVAISFGADDLDGTVVHETIYHAAGSDSPQELGVAELQRLIRETGREPVERDTLYNEVVRSVPAGAKWTTGRRLELV
jgi:aminodeoxyfutalosine synthase